uniref:Uncharacterized protein n=1 Tax=Trichuris muris TaxID=70415 RepID=A0A5S6QRD9_TRIMR
MSEQDFLNQPWTLSLDEIANLLQRLSSQQIINAIELTAEKEPLGVPKLCTLVFRGFVKANSSYEVFKETLFYTLQHWVLGRFDESVESSTVFVLLSEVRNLNTTDTMAMTVDLIKLTDNPLKGNRLAHLLPKLLQSLCSAHDVETSEGKLTGYEARSCIVDKIVDIPSTSVAASLLLAVLKDVDLSADEKEKLLERLMECMVELSLEEIQNFVLKLLGLLASESNVAYIGRLLEVSCSLTTRARYLVHGLPAIRNVQSSIMLHIMHAVRTQQSFGRILLNAFKDMKDIASSDFYLATLLCLSRLNRFQQKAQALIKNSVIESMNKKLNVKSSKWLRSIVECSNVEKTIDALISYESDSWEYVIEGLCELGFTFLEFYATRFVSMKGSLQCELFSLGKRLVMECFKHHHFIRRTVVERIMDAVMLQSPACDQLLRLFSVLVKIAPMTVIESRERLIDAFQVLPLLPLNCCLRFVKALIAIIDFKPEIRLALFKSLRNAVFSKDLRARQTGIACFLLFLGQKDLINVFSASQRSSSSQSFPTFSSQGISSANTKTSYLCVETMFLEMIGCFQRALRLQGELRSTLYLGLARAASEHPTIREPVLDLLYRQLEQYIPEEALNGLSILSLETCVAASKDGAHLLEPIGTLISSITALMRVNPSSEDCQPTVDFFLVDKVKCCLGSLASRTSDLQLEDFNLDKSVSYCSEETAGSKNILLAYQFLAMVEALVEFSILNFDNRKETAGNIMKLYALWNSMDGVLRERLGWRAQKRKLLVAESQADMESLKATSDGCAKCCVSISAIVSVLSLIFSNSDPANEDAVSIFRQEGNFVAWLFALALRRLATLDMELSSRSAFEDICILARQTLSYFRHGSPLAAEMNQDARLGCKALEVFSCCVDAINLHYNDKFEKSLSFLTAEFELSQDTWKQMEHVDRVYRFTIIFVELLVRNLGRPSASGETDKPEKASGQLMHMIEVFVYHVPPESSFYCEVFNNLLRICQQQSIGEITVVRRLWTMTLDMQKQIEIIPSTMILLAEELHVIFGDITEGDLDSEVHFASVNPKTAPVVVQTLLGQLERLLEDGIFALHEAKSSRLSITVGGKAEKGQVENMAGDVERGVCDIFCLVVLVWHELIQSRIPLKLIDNTVKGLEKVFKALTLLSKHYLTMCSKKLIAAPGDSFQKLAKRSGTDVTCHVYRLISYVQSESGNSRARVRQNSAKAKGETIREMRSLSSLIFAIETYEETLIQLSAKCNKNFMSGMKPSVNRDFRIDVNRIRAALNYEDDEVTQEVQARQVVAKGRRTGSVPAASKRRRRAE